MELLGQPCQPGGQMELETVAACYAAKALPAGASLAETRRVTPPQQRLPSSQTYSLPPRSSISSAAGSDTTASIEEMVTHAWTPGSSGCFPEHRIELPEGLLGPLRTSRGKQSGDDPDGGQAGSDQQCGLEAVDERLR